MAMENAKKVKRIIETFKAQFGRGPSPQELGMALRGEWPKREGNDAVHTA